MTDLDRRLREHAMTNVHCAKDYASQAVRVFDALDVVAYQLDPIALNALAEAGKRAIEQALKFVEDAVKDTNRLKEG